MLKVHETTRTCWCQPLLAQICPVCYNYGHSSDCDYCHRRGLVPVDKLSKSVIVIHNHTESTRIEADENNKDQHIFLGRRGNLNRWQELLKYFLNV